MNLHVCCRMVSLDEMDKDEERLNETKPKGQNILKVPFAIALYIFAGDSSLYTRISKPSFCPKTSLSFPRSCSIPFRSGRFKFGWNLVLQMMTARPLLTWLMSYHVINFCSSSCVRTSLQSHIYLIITVKIYCLFVYYKQLEINHTASSW